MERQISDQSDSDQKDSVSEPVQLIGLGELFWDGSLNRQMAGGAPANIAFHAQQLGLTAAVASRVGEDDTANQITDFLASQGLNTDLIQRDSRHPTGALTHSPESSAEGGYCLLENSAWDYFDASLKLLDAVRSAQAICFGTLAQRRTTSRTAIQKCLHVARKDCLVVYEMSLTPPFFAKEWIAKSLNRATIVILNETDIRILSELFNLQLTDGIRFARNLLDMHRQMDLVCVIRGNRGSVGVRCEEVAEFPEIPVENIDPNRVGDAFTAAVVFGRIQNWTLTKTVDLANRYSALVASRPATTPLSHDELNSLESHLDWTLRETPQIP